jgi:hypothetical protein
MCVELSEVAYYRGWPTSLGVNLLVESSVDLSVELSFIPGSSFVAFFLSVLSKLAALLLANKADFWP